MNRQQVFEDSVTGLVKQGRQSLCWIDSNTGNIYDSYKEGRYISCRYRYYTWDGVLLKCAIGQVLPDHLYSPVIEGNGLAHRFLESFVNYLKCDTNDIQFLAALQCVHDNNTPDKWEKAFAQFANMWKLDKKFLSNLDFSTLKRDQ